MPGLFGLFLFFGFLDWFDWNFVTRNRKPQSSLQFLLRISGLFWLFLGRSVFIIKFYLFLIFLLLLFVFWLV